MKNWYDNFVIFLQNKTNLSIVKRGGMIGTQANFAKKLLSSKESRNELRQIGN